MIIAQLYDAFMTTRRISPLALLGLIACILFILFSGSPLRTHVLPLQEPTFPRGEVILQSGEATPTLVVAIAATPEHRAHGMMYRESWGDIEGMLFLLPQAEPISMWMKDTPLPLDMVFINMQGRIAHIVEGAVPYSTDSISAPVPVTAILELPAGHAKKYGLQIGDEIDYSPLTQAL